jgi:hypothetical protein
MVVLLVALYWTLSFVVVATWLVICASFYALAFIAALVIWIVRLLVERKKPAPPHLPRGRRIARPTPQARFSDRR